MTAIPIVVVIITILYTCSVSFYVLPYDYRCVIVIINIGRSRRRAGKTDAPQTVGVRINNKNTYDGRPSHATSTIIYGGRQKKKNEKKLRIRGPADVDLFSPF